MFIHSFKKKSQNVTHYLNTTVESKLGVSFFFLLFKGIYKHDINKKNNYRYNISSEKFFSWLKDMIKKIH